MSRFSTRDAEFRHALRHDSLIMSACLRLQILMPQATDTDASGSNMALRFLFILSGGSASCALCRHSVGISPLGPKAGHCTSLWDWRAYSIRVGAESAASRGNEHRRTAFVGPVRRPLFPSQPRGRTADPVDLPLQSRRRIRGQCQ